MSRVESDVDGYARWRLKGLVRGLKASKPLAAFGCSENQV